MAPAGQRASQAVSAAHTGHRGARLEQPGQQESRGPSWNSPTHRRALPGGGKLQVGPLTSGKGTARWFMASLCPPPGKTIHSHAHVCTAGPATAVPLTKCAIFGLCCFSRGSVCPAKTTSGRDRCTRGTVVPRIRGSLLSRPSEATKSQ